MTATLVRKLLRDIRVALVAVAILVGAFQVLWARVTQRILGQLAPFLFTMASASGLMPRDVESAVFEGPGKLIRNLIGGESIEMDRAMDLLSVGYVHPLMQIVFCIWAVGRAAGAIAGELDRGTMELLLAQPLARYRLILAHLCVDLLTVPILCLSLWTGTCIGIWLVSPIKVETPPILKNPPRPGYLVEFGPLRVRLEDPVARLKPPPRVENDERTRERLKMRPWPFLRGLWLVGALMFAVSGCTMWLSALGRFRWRVLGLAVFLLLLEFLVNLIGTMLEPLEPLRPLTFFYYYQPQQVILSGDWCVTLKEWYGGAPLCRVNALAVLLLAGLAGYGLALWTFTRRDLPAPL
jgi:ABC-2 type transport system permease protein